MSRLYAFCATAEGQGATIINALPNTVYRNGRGGRGQELVYYRDNKLYSILLLSIAKDVNLGVASAAPSGNWDLWIMVADSRGKLNAHHRWLARAWRYLRRQSAEHPGWLRGPYSAQYVDDNWPAISGLWLKGDCDEDGNRQPGTEWSFPILAGDSHDQVVTWDYRPTQEEIDNDTDWSP